MGRAAAWLLPAFGVCQYLAVTVWRKHGRFHGFAPALVPLAVGLAALDPAGLALAWAGGVALAAVALRCRPAEAAVTTAVALAQALAGLAAFAALGGAPGLFAAAPGASAPDGWGGAATLAGSLVVAHAVTLVAASVASTLEGWCGWHDFRGMVSSGTYAAIVHAAVGSALALYIWRVPHSVLVVTAVVLACLWSNRLYDRLAERRRRLDVLDTFAGSFPRSVHLSEVARAVLERSRAVLRADSAVLLLGPVVDESDHATRLVLSPDGFAEEHLAGADLAADIEALVPDKVARIVRADGAGMPGWLPAMASGRALAAPITNATGEVSGALVVARKRNRSLTRYGEGHAGLLGTVAEAASMALENGALFAQLRREMETREHQATHDSLTDLPNRARLEELLDEAVVGVDGVRNRIGLLVIDLDEFSQVSDAFGHVSTDMLLVQACRRISGLLPESAVLCRIGPNEFAAILRDIDGVEEAIAAARLLIAGFDPPFQVEGVLLALALNIGVAVYPVHAVDVPSLIARTHIARETARRLRSGWELYDPMHDPATPRRLALGAELREAIEGNELEVCFQPKVEVTTGLVRGAEALVRWDHPRLGRVRPSEFIAVAEHTGDIRNLTMVVMRRSLAECRSWRDRGLDMSVAVNLSARNLLDLNLVDDVATLVEAAGVPPKALTLELTESMVMSDSQRSIVVLEGLAELGVCLSCDDFGTGYSSLAHLRRLPIGEIKIDRSFITRMTEEESDRAIARSVLALGRDLGLTTVAEGVESSAGLDMLGELGCDLAQGFYVCPPVPSHQFEAWLSSREAQEIPA